MFALYSVDPISANIRLYILYIVLGGGNGSSCEKGRCVFVVVNMVVANKQVVLNSCLLLKNN